MKRMNGTLTLAFVEEDNKQRVIFRVMPLCTREGAVFEDARDIFPDEGSLRIVPDKREQSTFKERMRSMGSLCVIDLVGSEGKELAKVRQNRNYDPAQGECNQNAIYSDVIEEFAPHSVFEILLWQEGHISLQEGSLTPEVLLLSNKVLYGPVDTAQLADVSLEALKPFGNDHFLMHTVEIAGAGKRMIYWNPEETVTWRQRRGSLRRGKGEKTAKGEAVEKDALPLEGLEESPEIQITQLEGEKEAPQPVEKKQRKVSRHALRHSDEAAGELEAEKPDAALPIGTKLEILDTSVPFEEQISRLDQPVSSHANRLAADQPQTEIPEESITLRFSGTPILRDAAHAPQTVSQPDPLHHVVERQLRAKIHPERPAALEEYMENPVEALMAAVDWAWQEPGAKEQSIAALLGNQGFMQSMLMAVRKSGMDMGAVTAAYEQLDDIEAERLSILMQLDQAKTAQKEYREKAIASATGKKREALEALRVQVEQMEKEASRLEALLQQLEDKASQEAAVLVAEHATGFSSIDDRGIVLSPVVGTHYDAQILTHRLYTRLNQQGFPINEDDAQILLIAFSLFPSLCFRAKTLADAAAFAGAFVEALGLESVTAVIQEGQSLRLLSLLAEEEHRTPTVSIQPLGVPSIHTYGHHTLYIANGDATKHQDSQPIEVYPTISVPTLQQTSFVTGASLKPVAPAAISSFAGVGAEMHPLLEEGEKWFDDIKANVATEEYPLPDVVLLHMRRFVGVAARRLRGGFLAAADLAMLQWVMPQMLCRDMDKERMQALVGCLPRCLEALEREL